jgi:hypothetical protein
MLGKLQTRPGRSAARGLERYARAGVERLPQELVCPALWSSHRHPREGDLPRTYLRWGGELSLLPALNSGLERA